jgi:ubiquinone/menaquinone biosynthesis C-methylase UbiE
MFAAVYPRIMGPKPARVLDVGCGPGTYDRWLLSRGDAVVGLDYSLPSLRQARRNERPLERAARYTQGDAYSLPFRAAVFDAVLCVGVLQTLSDEQRALEEMTRVLKPSGLLVLDGLNDSGLSSAAHWVRRARKNAWNEVRRYRPRSLRRCLLALGYSKIETLPVVIAPRRVEPLGQIVRRMGRLSILVAHSFFLFARKASDDVQTRAAGVVATHLLSV